MAGFVEGPRLGSVVSRPNIDSKGRDVSQASDSSGAPLIITDSIVQRALADVQELDVNVFLKEEYEQMERSNAAVALWRERLAKPRKGEADEKAGTGRAVGFSLAHRMLRVALEESGREFPPRDDRLIRSFETFTGKTPAGMFIRDFAGQEAVYNFVTRLKNDQTREGAMLLFSLYGRVANPTRGEINIPRSDIIVEFRSRRSARSKRRASRSAGRR